MNEEERKRLEAAEKAAREASAALEQLRADAADKAKKVEALEKDNATLKAENELFKSREAKFTADAKKAADESAAAEFEKKIEARVEEIVEVRADAAKYLGEDGKPYETKGKKPDAIRRDVIAALEPDYAEDRKRLDSLSGEALLAVYRLAVSHADKQQDAWTGLQDVVAGARNDARGEAEGKGGKEPDGDEMYDAAKARKDMEQRKRDAAKNRRDREAKMRDSRAAGGR